MKYNYKEMPESMKGTYGEFSKNFGFDWKEFIMGIPTPMFLVTTYKSNGQPNATMQSWAGFTSANQVCSCSSHTALPHSQVAWCDSHDRRRKPLL